LELVTVVNFVDSHATGTTLLLLSKKEAKMQKKNEGIACITQLKDQMAIDNANIGNSHP
jgi:hypothetical protein